MKGVGNWSGSGWHIPTVPALMAIVAVATVLRGIGLTRWSFWLDEIYSASLRSQEPIRDLLFVSYDPHPPLYFLLVKGWTAIVGTSPIAVRSLSLILSVGVVLGLFFLGRKLYDTQTGLIAAALVAVSTTQIHFGRNARMYPLLLLATVLSISFFLDLRKQDRRSTGLYLLATTILLYTHIYGLFVVLGQNLAMLRRGRYLEAISLRRWVGIQALLGITYLPWGIRLLEQVFGLIGDTVGQGISVGWIPDPSLQLLRNSLFLYAGSPWELYPIVTGNPTTNTIATVVLVVFGFSILAGMFDWEVDARSPHQTDGGSSLRPESRLLAILFGTIVLVPFVLSYLLAPIYFPRFTVAATVPLVLLVAFGLSSIERKPLQIGLLTLLIGSSLLLTVTYYQGDTLEPWDEAVSVVETNTDADDLVILGPEYIPGFFDYYYDGTATITTESGIDSAESSNAQDSPDLGLLDVDAGTRVCMFDYGEERSLEKLEVPDKFEQVTTFQQGVIRVDCYESSVGPTAGA